MPIVFEGKKCVNLTKYYPIVLLEKNVRLIFFLGLGVFDPAPIYRRKGSKIRKIDILVVNDLYR